MKKIISFFKKLNIFLKKNILKLFVLIKKIPSKIKHIDKKFFKIFLFCLVVFSVVVFLPKMFNYSKQNANLLLILEANEPMSGLMHWQIELDNRNKKATVLVTKELAEKYPDFFINMRGRGYKLVGYSDQDFWGMSYNDQLKLIQETKNTFNNLLETDLEVFATKNFSYDINTLKVAEKLNIEYILTRGTTKENSIIYDLKDFNVKLISISNVKDSNLNSTPISDYELHIRGSDIVQWEKHINDSITKKAKSISIVSNSFLGGTKKIYWDVYRLLINSDFIDINDFETWISKTNTISLKNIEVPINKEIGFDEVYFTPINKLESITDVEKYTINPQEKGKCPKGAYCY